MKINIETVPFSQMRYPGVGDYWYDEHGVLQVRIADLGDEFLEKTVMIHELVEEALTKKRGVSEQKITDFDLMFEEERKNGLHGDFDEPGFDNRSCYLQEHTAATGIEMIMCSMAGIKWNEYSDKINSL